MYDNTVIILADLKEFPHAQHYAECFSVLFSDIGWRDRRKDYKPSRHDYTKVYIVSKDANLIAKFKETHEQFGVEVYDAVPDYTGQEPRKVASTLMAMSCLDPFDDLKFEREKRKKQEALDIKVKEAEKAGKFIDPKPDVALDPNIKLKRKGAFRNA